MFTQIETVVMFEPGDLVECTINELGSFNKNQVYRIDKIEIDYKGNQNLVFQTNSFTQTIVSAKHFKIAKKAIKWPHTKK